MFIGNKQIIWIIFALAVLIALATNFMVVEEGFVWQTESDSHSNVLEYINRQEKAKDKIEEIEDIVVKEEIIKQVLFEVPFLVQAPTGEWDDPRFQDACEEAAVIMAWHWILGDKELTTDQAQGEILDLVDWQIKRHGNYTDTSATSTAQLMKDYYGYGQVEAKEIKGFEEI